MIGGRDRRAGHVELSGRVPRVRWVRWVRRERLARWARRV